MTYLKRALKSLSKKGEYNFIKIFSLSIGLAASLVMLAKVYFENSCDSFFLNNKQIYQIQNEFIKDNKRVDIGGNIPGGIAILAGDNMAQVENATRLTGLADSYFSTQDKSYYKAGFSLADSAFFTVFSQRVIQGDAAEILSTPLQAMITDEMAELMGGDPIGERIVIDHYPNVELTIAGIYEKLPENTHFNLDVLVSMPSIYTFWQYDGSKGMLGNDRYNGYVTLSEDASVEQAEKDLNTIFDKLIDVKKTFGKYGENLVYHLIPLTELHSGRSETKIMTWILVVLSIIILFAAVMNYILFVISSVVSRAKEIALHKCYGAANSRIYMMMLAESLVHVVLSLLLAALYLYFCRAGVELLIGRSIDTLFQLSNCWPLIVICIAVWLFSGLLPGLLFSYIPITTVFRMYTDNKRKWKMSLLFIQFATAGFLVAFLMIVSIQYRFMMNDDNVGYNYENVVYVDLSTATKDQRTLAMDIITQMPEVVDVSYSGLIPIYGASLGANNLYHGDNISVNFADLSFVDDRYLDFMQTPIIEGSGFKLKNGTEMMVSRSFVEKMNSLGVWVDNVIGEPIKASMYGDGLVICGVFEDFTLGNALHVDDRPLAMFCDDKLEVSDFNLLIRLKNSDLNTTLKIDNELAKLFPDRNPTVSSWKTGMEGLYSDELNLRNSVLVGSLIALLITILGLIGYLNNEINRRSKEIAIRKINGAIQSEVIMLFIRQISLLSIIAFTIGAAGAMLAGIYWQEMFAFKASIEWYVYVGSVAILTLSVCIIIILNSLSISRSNPTKYLKS